MGQAACKRLDRLGGSRYMVHTEGDVDTADRQSDVGDFSSFFEANARRLTFSLWLITRNRDEAEELAQEAFVKILERWDHVRGLDDPPGYLFRTGANLASKRRRHLAVALRRAARPMEPPDEMANVDGLDRVQRALEGLSRAQRSVVVLVDLLGMDSTAAADVMGIRAATVRVHLSRARAALRDRIGDDHDE
jgi:RNA polymerase sigma-70 factor, ECF subfamily